MKGKKIFFEDIPSPILESVRLDSTKDKAFFPLAGQWYLNKERLHGKSSKWIFAIKVRFYLLVDQILGVATTQNAILRRDTKFVAAISHIDDFDTPVLKTVSHLFVLDACFIPVTKAELEQARVLAKL